MSIKPGIQDLFFSFLRLGLTAFGGPAMVAYIRELAVNRRQWLSESEFRDGLVLCQSIPGATAMQAAAYVGLRTNGISGALASYVGFGLPAFVFMLVLSSLYIHYKTVPYAVSLFDGLQVIVVAVVFNAVYSFGRGMIGSARNIAFALAAAALFWMGVSPFIVILAAALAGVIFVKETVIAAPGKWDAGKSRVGFGKRSLLVFLAMTACFAGLYVANARLFDLAAVMMQIDLFAFGGGFASVPLMLQKVVHVKEWMGYRTFMDGIALGQVTPGPIVMTATFVGYLLDGVSGALTATVAVFTPSFLLLVGTASIFDRLKFSRTFAKATDGILASFLGLLLYVGIRFSVAVPWGGSKLLLGVAALAALIRGVDIVYVVAAGAIYSLLFF